MHGHSNVKMCTDFSNLFLGIKSYIFQTVPLSIIRSFSLYTQQWHMPLLCVQWKTPDNGQRNSLKHVTNTAVVYVIQVCKSVWHIPLLCVQWKTDDGERNSPKHVTNTAVVYVIQVCKPVWHICKPVWHIPLLSVQWKAPDDGQRNSLKHVEVYFRNKFEKLVHLVGLIIRIYHDARSHERQIL